jgi:hypothetical protein
VNPRGEKFKYTGNGRDGLSTGIPEKIRPRGSLPFPIEWQGIAVYCWPHEKNMPPTMAHGKVLAFVPMMDGNDNSSKSIR